MRTPLSSLMVTWLLTAPSFTATTVRLIWLRTEIFVLSSLVFK